MKIETGTATAALALVSLLLITLAIYLPGLSGAFLFDDWSNLKLLGHLGNIDRFDKLVHYLLSGFSGPTGRPVALASFLLDSQTWPALPAPFKRTNLLIHLLNGALLTALIWQLANRLGASIKQSAWIAVLAAGLWLLHPLWVSTTLYVVQRMAMLSTTFVLAGLVTYLYGRRLIFSGQLRYGYLWTTFSLVIFGLLAVFSKENGALLPLLILVLERYALDRTNLYSSSLPRGWRAWKIIFLVTPASLVLIYLSGSLPALFHGSMGSREFTPGQRLLTQARIIMDYLGLLILPRPYSGGLFTDTIEISKNLFTPFTTFLGCSIITSLIILAEKLRRQTPTISLAIMFFLTGHIMESTWLPLELYFEHRNYLPATLLFLPLAWWLAHATNLAWKTRTVIALTLLSLLAGETMIRSTLWGKPFVQALTWARQNLDSPRAQTYLASFWMKTGNHAEARHLLQTILEKKPNDLLSIVSLIGAECRLNNLSPQNINYLFKAMQTANVRYLVNRYQIDRTLSFLRRGKCSAIDDTIFEKLLNAGLGNPMGKTVPQWRKMLYQQRAQLRLTQNLPDEAYADLIQAIEAVSTYDGILASTALLARAGHLRLALRLIDTAPRPDEHNSNTSINVGRLRKLWMKHRHYYAHELQVLRKTIENDLMRDSRKTAL